MMEFIVVDPKRSPGLEKCELGERDLLMYGRVVDEAVLRAWVITPAKILGLKISIDSPISTFVRFLESTAE